MMQLAISEALVGLADQAKARIEKADDDGILNDATLDERMVVAAITKDAATARELLPQASAEQRRMPAPHREGASRRRTRDAERWRRWRKASPPRRSR